MVTQRRLHAIVLPLALYVFSAAVAGFFVWHAVNGERGLKTRKDFQEQMQALAAENRALLAERERLERRVVAMRSDAVDRDLLEEEARRVLGLVHPSDAVVFLSRNRAPATKDD